MSIKYPKTIETNWHGSVFYFALNFLHVKVRNMKSFTWQMRYFLPFSFCNENLYCFSKLEPFLYVCNSIINKLGICKLWFTKENNFLRDRYVSYFILNLVAFTDLLYCSVNLSIYPFQKYGHEFNPSGPTLSANFFRIFVIVSLTLIGWAWLYWVLSSKYIRCFRSPLGRKNFSFNRKIRS